jgi:hypothetical protein
VLCSIPPETANSDEKAEPNKDQEKEEEDKKGETVTDSKGRAVTVFDDDDEELDCNFLRKPVFRQPLQQNCLCKRSIEPWIMLRQDWTLAYLQRPAVHFA